jgi:Domain of unknown function (DUF5666)
MVNFGKFGKKLLSVYYLLLGLLRCSAGSMEKSRNRGTEKRKLMYRSSKQKMIRRIGLSSVAAATALGLGFTVANASTTHSTGTQSIAAKAMAGRADAPKDGFGHFNALEVHGTISALTATSVTITDPSGAATTYTLASGLTVTKEHVAASVADLAVGQRVEAQLTAAGSTTINSIDIDVARVMGQVTSVSGSSITVSTPRGSETFNVTGSTTYTLDGVAASVSDLTVGKYVMAMGDNASTPSNFTAVSVAISTTAPAFGHDGPNGDYPNAGPMAGGRVTAVNGSTITVTDPHGNTDTITVDGSTTYTFNNAAGNLGEVTVGSYVFAQGTATGSGALTATSVAISTSAPTFAHPGDGDGPGQGQFGDH